jgi:hypothetical protein
LYGSILGSVSGSKCIDGCGISIVESRQTGTWVGLVCAWLLRGEDFRTKVALACVWLVQDFDRLRDQLIPYNHRSARFDIECIGHFLLHVF